MFEMFLRFRHLEVADDPTLSEDAHFVLDVPWPTSTTDTVNYVGLADGVGSWRRVGVDPREFRCVFRVMSGLGLSVSFGVGSRVRAWSAGFQVCEG